MAFFQNQVYINPVEYLPGDFTSVNPYVYKQSANGVMVAGSGGVRVGRFAFIADDGTVSGLSATAVSVARVGLVHAELNAVITTWMGVASDVIPPGQPVALIGAGDMAVAADVVTGTPARGAAVFWNSVNGQTIIGAPASPPATTIDTGWTLVSASATVGGVVAITKLPGA